MSVRTNTPAERFLRNTARTALGQIIAHVIHNEAGFMKSSRDRQLKFATVLFVALSVVYASAPVPFAGQAAADDTPAAEGKDATKDVDKTADDAGWTPLKGKWDFSRYGGEGPVEITDEGIEMGFGDPLTGVRWTGDYPKDNYEIRLEAQRTDAHDFFVAVTFPVGDQHCSLVLGGWGGGVTGISNIDGNDASSNDTTLYRMYENDQWYKIHIRVVPKEIVCKVDGEIVVQVEREGVEFDIRDEMDPALPLGLANYQCVSEIRNIAIRTLDKAKPDATSQPKSDK